MSEDRSAIEELKPLPVRRHQEFAVELGVFETYPLLMPLKWLV
jgi:hypothetical protein